MFRILFHSWFNTLAMYRMRRAAERGASRKRSATIQLQCIGMEDRVVPARVTLVSPDSMNPSVPGGSAIVQAQQFLATHADLLGLDVNKTGDLTHVFTRETAYGSVERFQQEINGVPVYGAEVVVSVLENGTVNYISDDYKSGLSLSDTIPSIAAPTARGIALSHMNATGSNSFEANKLVVFPTSDGARLAYLVEFIPREGHIGDFAVIVDADTGAVLQAVDRANYATGSGTVFNPDPLSTSGATYGDTGFTDASDADSTQLTAQRTTVTLLDITQAGSNFTLIGPYAQIVDTEAPFNGLFTQASSTFNFTRSQDGFEAVNTYYHVDAYMRYLNETLGLTVAPTQYVGGVKFDPSGLNGDDNSHYLGGSGVIAFGEGGVDDAEDADVVIHELGHGIHDWVTGGNLSQVNGLSEGVGDYFAQSYSRALGLYTSSDPEFHFVFNWDGHNEFYSGRLTNSTSTYPDDLVGQVHADGMIWSTANMKVWDALGAAKTDALMVEGLALTGSSTNQEQAAQALLQAAVNLSFSQSEIHTIFLIYDATGYNVTEPTGMGGGIQLHAPVFTSTPATTATENIGYSYVIQATDADGDALPITAPTLPAWLTLFDFGNGFAQLDGLPGPGDVGPNSVVLEVPNVSTLENFDGVTAPALPSGWTSSATGAAATNWVTSNASSDTAPNSVFVADPANVSDSRLTSPVVTIDSSTPQLRFQHSFNLETDGGTLFYDGGVLEISIDGGAFTDIVTAGGSFASGGYNVSLRGGSGQPLGAVSAWGGNSGGFITSVVDLPAAAIGADVQFRWRMGSDGSVGSTGWNIDSIELIGAPVQQTFIIDVAGLIHVHAPTFDTTPFTTATEGAGYLYDITVSDSDNDPIPVSAPTLPTWLDFLDDGFGNAQLVGAPAAGNVGPNSVLLEVPNVSLLENFDGVTAPALPSGWTSTATGAAATNWVTSSTSSNTAPNSAFVADPDDVSDNKLTSPVFVIEDSSITQLRFRHNYDLEAGYDGGVLEISVAGGVFTDILTAGGIFASGGYNGTLDGGLGQPLGAAAAWTGSSSGFITTLVNLPSAAIAGSTVQFRWRMGSDGSVSSTGWRIDSIELIGAPVQQSFTITVIAGNQAPTVGGIATPISYTENATLILAPAGTVTDTDSPNFSTGTLTVNFTANGGANDRLAIRNQGTGAGQVGVNGNNITFGGVTVGTKAGGTSGTSPLVVTFNANATPARVQAVLRNVTYQLLSESPTVLSRGLRYTLTDGDGGTSVPVNQAVNIVPVNDVPVAAGVATPISYTENATLLLAPNGTVSDLDSANLDTGKLTVALTTNAGANDRVAIRHQGFAAGQIGVSGVNVSFGGVPIGTISGGVGTAPLVVTFNASATPARVQALLRNVTYQLLFDNPTILSRNVRYTLTDGDGGTSAAVNQALTIVPVNDVPVAAGVAPSIPYTENATLLLAPNGTVSDLDSANLDTGKLTVALTSNAGANDRLIIRNQGTGAGLVGVSGSNVTFGGSAIGTFSGGVGTAPLVVTFNASATPAIAQAVLRNVTYQLLFDNPTILSRNVRYTLTDGDGGTSVAVNQALTIVPVNDAPVLGGITGPQTYHALAAPLLVAPSATVSDVDSSNFDTGKLTVSFVANAGPADRLAIRNQGTGAGQVGVSGTAITFGGITIGSVTGGTSNTSPLVVTFNSSATATAVQAVLRNVTYFNTSATPSTAARTLRFKLTDGDGGTSATVDEVVNVSVP